MTCFIYAELMQFLERLNDRHEAKLKKDNVLMARKVRHLGEVAHRPTNDAEIDHQAISSGRSESSANLLSHCL